MCSSRKSRETPSAAAASSAERARRGTSRFLGREFELVGTKDGSALISELTARRNDLGPRCPLASPLNPVSRSEGPLDRFRRVAATDGDVPDAVFLLEGESCWKASEP